MTTTRFWLPALLILVLVPLALAEDEKAAPADGKAKLLSNGAEPRQVLRYAPIAGSKYDQTIKMNIEVESIMGAMTSPTFAITCGYEIVGVAENKDFVGKVVLRDFAAEGEDTTGMAGVFLAQFAGMKGLSAEATYTCHGEVKSTKFSKSEFADPGQQQAFDGLKDTLGRMPIVLPGDPVGVGAKWSVSRPAKSSGIETTLVTTYEVVKIDGSTVEFKDTLEQTAAEQVITMQGMPATVRSYQGKGTATGVIDLTMGAAKTSTLAMAVDMNLEIDTGVGAPRAFDQAIRQRLTITLSPARATTDSAETDGDDGDEDEDGG